MYKGLQIRYLMGLLGGGGKELILNTVFQVAEVERCLIDVLRCCIHKDSVLEG